MRLYRYNKDRSFECDVAVFCSFICKVNAVWFCVVVFGKYADVEVVLRYVTSGVGMCLGFENVELVLSLGKFECYCLKTDCFLWLRIVS